ncbi:MAG: hypothetical protein J6W19_06515 [Prevotella sp.]|nr:hypothetical protein [Prevotella sp.]
MKYILNIFAVLALTFGVTACSEDSLPSIIDDAQVPEGEMRVNLLLSVPAADNVTRSMLPGDEKKVTTLKMVCFDANGYYLGEREAQVAQTSTDPDHGTVKGNVPGATCRIHFIANRPHLDLSSVPIGTSENNLMQWEVMTTTYNEADAEYVTYWGYHKESNEEDMKVYLKGQGTEHIVYLLRDRAQVRIVDVSDEDQMNIDRIYSVEWTISNGRDRGYLAPYNSANVRDPFDGYYSTTTEGGNTVVTGNSVITEYPSSGRYTATESDIAQNGKIIVGGENTLKPIYLFEDYNEGANLQTADAPVVKLILKVTYMYDDNGNAYAAGATRKVKYHTALLMNQEFEMFHVTRNHTYSLTIKGLPRSLGKDTFAEALTNTNYTNNQLFTINEEATDVTDGTHSLSIKTTTGTSVVYTESETVTIPFTYMTNGAGDPNLTSANFSAVWKKNEDVAETSLPITYNPSTGEGTITLTLKEVGTSLKEGKLLLTDKAYGLQRYVNVYTISQFSFRDKTLTRVGTRTVNGKTRPVYQLTLKFPAGSNRFPKGLYPITIKFATQTLNAFSDENATTTTEGLCGLTMSSTAVDDVDNGATTGNGNNLRYPWNYQARDWGYWYSYIVLTQDDMKQGADGGDEINLYFDDICGEAHPNSTFSSVGLYYEIEYFGGIKSIYANRPNQDL